MALEDLMEKTTKMFPKPMTLAQLRRLCDCVASALATFEIKLYGDHSEKYGNVHPEDGMPFYEQRVGNLTGAISGRTASANFTFITNSPNDPVEPYKGLRFDTMPYDHYEEIPEARRNLMDKFYAAIDDYLKSIE